MELIKTSRQLGQAVKNVQRFRQVVAVFTKHGFVDFVRRMRLEKFLPAKLAEFAQAQAEKSTPERLCLAFEELGPAFIKFGQMLSTRQDLLPEAYIERLTRLQDGVQPLPFEIVKRVVEKELGKPLDMAFASFEENPIAAASIGQAHGAVLVTGEKVVLKVQRPDIEKIIETDISLLAFTASMLERYVPESRVINPVILVDELFRTLSQELDFKIEAANMKKIAENMTAFPELVIPKVYKALSTYKVLTMERLEGIRVNDLAAMDAAGIDRKKIVQLGARAFFKSVMADGIFHGDMHGGNMFVLPGDRLGVIDFGIVGRLSQRSRDMLANMVMAIVTEDFETLCYQYAELGAVGPSIDFDAFQREVRNTISPYIGLSVGEVNVGKILVEATRIGAKYEIKVPGEWMLVFKAILTMEGMGRVLDPDFDLIATGQDLIKDLVKNQYSIPRISKELMWVAKDVTSLLQTLPRHLRWMFRKFSANDFALEVHSPELKLLRDDLRINGKRTSLSVLIAGLFIASSIALQHSGGHMLGDYPVLSVIYFVTAILILLRLFIL